MVATNRSAGYAGQRVFIMVISVMKSHKISRLPRGSKEIEIIHTRSVAASIGAVQHFISERKFKKLLFKNGLPWITEFEGLNDKIGTPKKEDGTMVVLGNIGEEFGAENILFRTARA